MHELVCTDSCPDRVIKTIIIKAKICQTGSGRVLVVTTGHVLIRVAENSFAAPEANMLTRVIQAFCFLSAFSSQRTVWL